MENQLDISNSYFINKSNIKNKNIRRHEKIKAYEEVKLFIIETPYYNIEAKLILSESINEEINKIKDKISKDTLIYSY